MNVLKEEQFFKVILFNFIFTWTNPGTFVPLTKIASDLANNFKTSNWSLSFNISALPNWLQIFFTTSNLKLNLWRNFLHNQASYHKSGIGRIASVQNSFQILQIPLLGSNLPTPFKLNYLQKIIKNIVMDILWSVFDIKTSIYNTFIYR